MTPVQASRKLNEKIVFDNLRIKREKQKPKIRLGGLFGTSDIKNVFPKCDSTNYSYQLYTTTEVIRDTVPTYKSKYKPERYSQNLLLPTELSLGENNQVLKQLNLIQ